MSAIRAIRQLTSASTRSLLARQVSVSRSVLPSLAARVSVPAATRALSVTACRRGEGTSDVALAQKLQEEIQYEKETAESEQTPEFLQAFREQGLWEIEDVVGNDEVVLLRKFGNENLRLVFSIADLQAEEEDFENPEAEDEAGERSESEPSGSYPLRTSLTVTKTNGTGSLNIDMVVQEGHFIVDNISFYKDAKIGTDLTAEADWKRRGLYIGPQFETLDVGVQEEFEKYLQERGVNESVALFIPEYAEYKEQHEYVSWLNNVKSFVEL